MRSSKIKQARLTKQVSEWSSDKDIYNVCENHTAIVDRDRSCCVEQCPIIVSEFSLPGILHRPLPFRLKEGTPHRYLCLGHNLRYIDTLRKPMSASAISEAINNSSKKDKETRSSRRQKAKEAKYHHSDEREAEEDEGDGGGDGSSVDHEEGGRGDDNNEGDDKYEEEEGEEDKSEGSENGEKKKESKKRERRKKQESATNEDTPIDKVCTRQ